MMPQEETKKELDKKLNFESVGSELTATLQSEIDALAVPYPHEYQQHFLQKKRTELIISRVNLKLQ